MGIKDVMLPEYDHEMGTTRRLLERLPDSELGWRPHAKSMSLGTLAGHLAQLPQWCRTIIEHASFDLNGAGGPPTEAHSRAEVLAAFDQNVAAARALLATKTDAELMATWTLTRGNHEMFTLPKIAALRSFLLNHSIHHRGQLSVYLRLKDVPLPSMYGPSADEEM